MERIRRSRYAVVRVEDRPQVDWMAAALGIDAVVNETGYVGASPLTGTSCAIDRLDVDLMARLSDTEWTESSALEQEGWSAGRLEGLVRNGLAVSDPAADPESARLRTREEILHRDGWEPNAAMYHFLGAWSDVDVRGPDGGTAKEETRQAQHDALLHSMTDELLRIAGQHGPPPSPFRASVTGTPVALPTPSVSRSFSDLLGQRCTTRHFAESPIEATALSTILQCVFGLRDVRETPVGPLVRKTSPSGGSLHPIEVYPLLINVRDFESGLHHYNVRDHSLTRIEGMTRGEAADLAQRFAAGQPYAGTSAVAFLMTARFGRTFWKYRNHPKAYRVVMMDAGHLSQTFYLTCATLGLGAFVTAAINEVDVESRLGLTSAEEGAVGLLGCGPFRD